MDKLLSIAICAYNMEALIENALKSCIIKDIDKIEVLIMNDGSTDRTAEITQKYVDMYPGTFKLVNKENGGWGSNLNMAVQIATGKYFKELDADDWYDTETLQILVEIMESEEADLFITNHKYCYIDHSRDYVPDWRGWAKESILKDTGVFYFPIWDAAYLTANLRRNHIDLPKRCLYTDNLFILYAFKDVKKVRFIDSILYNYRLEREGQSVSVESLKKHYKELVIVLEESFKYYKNNKNDENSKHLLEKVRSTYAIFLEFFIALSGCKEIGVKKIVKDLDKDMKVNYPEVFRETGKMKKVKLLRKTNYLALGYVRRALKKRK